MDGGQQDIHKLKREHKVAIFDMFRSIILLARKQLEPRTIKGPHLDAYT